jgi:hypothetical protein
VLSLAALHVVVRALSPTRKTSTLVSESGTKTSDDD